MTNTTQSVSSMLTIVTDPVDLYYGKNPIECEVNSFLRGLIGDRVEADEIVTISYLLNMVEIKKDPTTGNKTWNFLPENIERVMSVLKGITLDANNAMFMTTYDSVLSVLLTIVAKVVNKFVLGERH